ncbi:hypothetical protein Vadar_022440 [Vaccinium darrowii]|uniref:Uncharacterized protein n=1 Tax=Vaccinium darrowii TaxID=229202 RepID=A0ACB7Y8K6_9ERIC|nr:hypothetical protein Vadar_022440 [Vaccinium darrowii]
MNNQAEYEVLITCIQLAKAMGTKYLAVISNSQLVVSQVNGEYEAKEESMGKYLNLVKKLAKSFEKFSISQVPQEENLEADKLARLASAKDELIPGDVMMQHLENPSIVKPAFEMKVVEYAGSWLEPIIWYICDGEVPSDKDQARKFRIRVARYALMGDVFYRRSFTLPYFRCLIKMEAEQLMGEVHEGLCGGHHGGQTLAYELIRMGYYWPTMQNDCIEMGKKCDRSQKFANISHKQPTSLTPMRGP